MKIALSDHFTIKKLLRFAMPSMIMMVFISIYSVVDGLFISNYVGSNAMSAIGIVMPLINVIGAFGFMFGTGGSAEVAKKLGEKNEQKANSYFTLLTISVVVVGIVVSLICLIFVKPICYMLGATQLIIQDCITYASLCVAGITLFMLQAFFHTFFVVAEKQKIGLALTIISGITNMILDWLFVAVFKWQIAGAALATGAGYLVGSLVPIIYFLSKKNKSRLHFVKPKWEGKMLVRSMINGSSEMVSNISGAITTFLFNKQLMTMVGEDGVAAISIMSYANFVFIAIFFGFSMGTSPIISYHYGAKNRTELHCLFKKCLSIIITFSISIYLLSKFSASTLVKIFCSGNAYLEQMTLHGFNLFSFSFLICGINIFASSFFTALCNGKISAILSFLRTLIFQVIAILGLPVLLGLNGIWLALPIAEFLTLVFSVAFLVKYKKQYQY